jgi:MSHA biogenesis protein MshJ
VDERSLRERVFVAGAVALVVWAVWSVALWDGIAARRAALTERIESAQGELDALAGREDAARAALAADPDAPHRAERERLADEVARLDARMAERSRQLIAPAEMVSTLREILARQEGLSLARFELLPPASALPEIEEAPRAARRPRLYRHAVEMEWVGGYMETLRYLRAVERLGWTLYWETLDYRVTRHPEAHVTLRLSTLSEQEGWIGV